jgi:hypothetical protein
MIAIELQQDEWIKILDMIADHPFRQVAPLMSKIQQQMMPQMKEQQSLPKGNGTLHNTAPGE